MYYGQNTSGVASNGLPINGRLELDTGNGSEKAAFSWLLYKKEDRFGNYIEYIYGKDIATGEVYIQNILFV